MFDAQINAGLSQAGYTFDNHSHYQKVIVLIFKGATSRYFELFLSLTKLPLNWRKPENYTLER